MKIYKSNIEKYIKIEEKLWKYLKKYEHTKNTWVFKKNSDDYIKLDVNIEKYV